MTLSPIFIIAAVAVPTAFTIGYIVGHAFGRRAAHGRSILLKVRAPRNLIQLGPLQKGKARSTFNLN